VTQQSGQMEGGTVVVLEVRQGYGWMLEGVSAEVVAEGRVKQVGWEVVVVQPGILVLADQQAPQIW